MILYCFFAVSVNAQKDSLQKEINEQVWKPFIKAFSQADTDVFMTVHSKDMTRVLQDSKIVRNYDEYYLQNKRGDERAKQGNRKRNIELRFIQRIAGNGRGFEVGYYKTTYIAADGKSQSFYGKFHVLLRKEDGKWKILMDADAQEKTDEAVFSAAAPLE